MGREPIRQTIVQVGQALVEEVAGVGELEIVGARREPLDPGLDRRDGHDLVPVALDDEPRRGGGVERRELGIEGDRRGDGDEPRDGEAQRCADGDEGPEREAGEPQGVVRPPRPKPLEGREDVVGLADGVGELAFALADSPEVEAQRVQAELVQRAREDVHHLVLHRAAVQRVRVAHDRGGGRRPFGFRAPAERLEPAGGPIDEEALGAAGVDVGHGVILGEGGKAKKRPAGRRAFRGRDGQTIGVL